MVEEGKGEQGKGKRKGGKVEGGKSKRRVTIIQTFTIFFPRAIAPFTGINFQSNQLACKGTSQLVFSNNEP